MIFPRLSARAWHKVQRSWYFRSSVPSNAHLKLFPRSNLSPRSSSQMIISVSRRLASSTPSLWRKSCRRCLATSAGPADPKAYSATLLLPKTTLPLKHKDPVAAELAYRARTTDDLYKNQVCAGQLSWLMSSGRTTRDHFSCFTTGLRTQTGICTWVSKSVQVFDLD